MPRPACLIRWCLGRQASKTHPVRLSPELSHLPAGSPAPQVAERARREGAAYVAFRSWRTIGSPRLNTPSASWASAQRTFSGLRAPQRLPSSTPGASYSALTPVTRSLDGSPGVCSPPWPADVELRLPGVSAARQMPQDKVAREAEIASQAHAQSGVAR